ncbi:MAG: carbohydrate-binding domain-containing protein, partial [Oscillospiraceae bacterium]|nr:carbohydrate-binding domain-containing protein [Oscillospiraceae bacterium]
MKKTRRSLAMLIALCIVMSLVYIAPMQTRAYDDAHTIILSSTLNADGSYTHSAVYDDQAVTEYDYTWHADPSTVHTDVSNSPAEYYTGTEPGGEAVYIAHDIYYYPELDSSAFVKTDYDGEQEWVYYYTAEGYTSYIFSTLPVSGSSVPTSMMHSPEDAYENAVLHITQPGDYIIEGTWHGQIWVDLGDYCDDPFTDPTAKVNLILNGVDIECTVAAGVVFYDVYECDNTWEDQTSWSHSVDTSEAGAVVTLADGTTNNVSGTNIFRILKTQYKSGSTSVQKKRLKIDGAFYSYQSMNIQGGTKGTGVLNITAGYEGLNSELHLTINGGNVYINSQDDGINVNEDNVSVLAVNGGNLHILAGLGSEGDGIDSNGFISINGGTTISMANPGADSGMDSDFGTYVFGGNVVALGSTMDWAANDTSVSYTHATMNLQFSSSKSAGDSIVITDTAGNGIFAYDPDKDEVTGANVRTYTGAIVSCDSFEIGQSYNVYIGGEVTGTETMGVYDMTTVTSVSNTYQQSYGSSSSSGGSSSRPSMPGSSSSSSSGSSGTTAFTFTNNVNKFSSVANYSSATTISVTPQEAVAVEPDYYLFGYINGANYACEEDYENLGEYKFVDGTLTATFDVDSYVAIKTGDNANWYMTQAYITDTTGTFYNTNTGAAEKMFVPAGVIVTFTLTDNGDDPLTMSYTTEEIPCDHSYELVTYAATCQDYADYVYTCSACGDSYTLHAEELAASWLETIPDGMDESAFTSKAQYRYRDVASTQWKSVGTGTVLYVDSWPSGFDTTNALYAQYDNKADKVTASETDTTKVTVDSDAVAGYLYYHWCYTNSYTSTEYKTGSYTTFHAYYSTTAPSNYQCDYSDMSYKTSNTSCCTNSNWFFVTEVYAQSYTNYELQNVWGDWTEWSDTVVTASDTREVETRTVYQLAEAALADHSHTSTVVDPSCTEAGSTTYTCTVCGDQYTETIAAVGHSYSGGSCTVCGAADPDYSTVVQPTLALSYGTVSFESEILYNIYFNASNLDSVVEMGMITFDSQLTDGTIDDAVKVYSNYSTDGTLYMVATDGIAAKRMADQMWFKIYAKLTDGSYVYTTVNYYSAVRYANSIL